MLRCHSFQGADLVCSANRATATAGDVLNGARSGAWQSFDMLREQVVDEGLVAQPSSLGLAPHGVEDLRIDPNGDQPPGFDPQGGPPPVALPGAGRGKPPG